MKKFIKNLFYRNEYRKGLRRYVEMEYGIEDREQAYDRLLKEAGL